MSGQTILQAATVRCNTCGKENRSTSKFCQSCGSLLDSGAAPAFSQQDLDDLIAAKKRLEHPNWAAQVANYLGKPIEAGLALLPTNANEIIAKATNGALSKGLELSVKTLDDSSKKPSRDRFHQLLVTGTGAAGGAAGLVALTIELPISTSLMLRSIADIARSEGHDLKDVSVRLWCLEVLALGGSTSKDDASEQGYWAVRVALASAIREAAAFIAKNGVAAQGAPQLVRLVASIASRFGVMVTEQVAFKAVPVVGAVSGAGINLLFMQHFQEMARGHFVIKRLEAKYGTDVVMKKYNEIQA